MAPRVSSVETEIASSDILCWSMRSPCCKCRDPPRMMPVDVVYADDEESDAGEVHSLEFLSIPDSARIQLLPLEVQILRVHLHHAASSRKDHRPCEKQVCYHELPTANTPRNVDVIDLTVPERSCGSSQLKYMYCAQGSRSDERGAVVRPARGMRDHVNPMHRS